MTNLYQHSAVFGPGTVQVAEGKREQMEQTQDLSHAERILVALDGSAPSNRALDKAISLAEKCQGKIYLIRILEMEAQDGPGKEGQNRLVEDMQAKLGNIREGRGETWTGV